MSKRTELYGDDLAAWERFAAASLEGWAAGRNNDMVGDVMTGDVTCSHHARVALACGRYADALMAERQKRMGGAE